ncbi:MAG: hypothetical protein ACLR23_14720 [Clostridia bacterium]
MGSAETLKLDAEYPENTLAGAVFGIYADTSGNQKFEEGIDRYIGNMTELENGQHRMEGCVMVATSATREASHLGSYRTAATTISPSRRTAKPCRWKMRPVWASSTPYLWGAKNRKTDSADHAPLPNVGFRIRDSLGAVGGGLHRRKRCGAVPASCGAVHLSGVQGGRLSGGQHGISV